MRFLLIPLAALIAAVGYQPCPPRFEIGQRWPEVVKACPDMEQQAFDRHGDLVSYYCPSQKVAVLGDVTTGQAIGFVKIDYDPHKQ